MSCGNASKLIKYAFRTAFGGACYIAAVNACFAQAEPPLGVARAGLLTGVSSGCDPLSSNSSLYGAAPIASVSPTANTTSAPNPAGTDNLPLYGTDLSGNAPLYSTPDLGGTAPLYGTLTPGMNGPLYSNTGLLANKNGGNNPGTSSNAVNAQPTRCRSGIPVGQWLLYPSITASSLYSNNLFLTPVPIKAVGLGATPALTAQWTDGIWTTIIFGNISGEYYPTDTTINTLNSEATVTQKYSPLPDLTFTVVGDYQHQTISSSLTNSIPTSVTTPPAVPTLLPNGDTVLPNGNIISPSGQLVGNINQALALNGSTLVNPYNQYTGTGTVSKIFNGAILTLSASIASTDYQQIQGTGTGAFTSFTTQTFTEATSVALGPLFYVYSNGDFSLRNQNSSVDSNSDAYRVIGGLGTRQFGLFRASGYYGYQASQTEGSGGAGGTVYGASLSYYPTFLWTIIGQFDQTNNISTQTVASTQALFTPTNLPVQIPLSSSTSVSTPSLQSIYQLTPQWGLLGDLSYSRIAGIGGPELTQTWFASLALSYEIRRNMTLVGQYQYSNIASNIAGGSGQRSLIMLSANYRF
jgi:hypothetical protein